MPRAYNVKEVRDTLLKQFVDLANYWANVENQACKDKLHGLAFSILNIFDGSTMVLPAMDIVLRPHEEDKQFHIDRGENYFKDGMAINATDCLHESYHDFEKGDTGDSLHKELMENMEKDVPEIK